MLCFRLQGLILLLLFVPGFVIPTAAKGGTVSIYYTGAIRGELEPCGCSPSLQSGGLSRLSAFVRSERDHKKNFILIDAGNSAGKDTPPGRLKTETLVMAFSAIGFDAIAGFFEYARAGEFAAGLFKRHNVLLLNPADKDNLSDSVVLKRKRYKINISVNPQGQIKNALNILLTDMNANETGWKGWDVVVMSSGETLEAPIEKDGTIIVSGFERGQKLGILKVSYGKSGKVRLVSHVWQTLPLSAAEDAVVRKLINEYDLAIAELMKAEEARQAKSGPYLGAASCKECHAPHYESYSASHHSGAFETLEKVGKSRNPECVACHTTGYGADGGFISKTSTPGLAGVGCEACHGPGREHLADLYRPVFRMMPVDVCNGCHTKQNSPGFNFSVYLKRITH